MAIAASFRQWLFRLARDDRLPIVLVQRRIFILPSRAGLLYAVVLAVMLIGAINYDLALGHALVFLLAGVGLVAMLHTFRNLLGLRLTPGHAVPVFAGGNARFVLHIEAPPGQARRALEFSFADAPQVAVDTAAETGRASAVLSCPAPRRGRLDPGRITLATRYPLGLFRAWSYLLPPLSCIVYPRPLETPLPTAGNGMRTQHRSGQYNASGDDDFVGLRQHQPADSPRHVAWKALARDSEHGPLLVKQFAAGDADELWLDWFATSAATAATKANGDTPNRADDEVEARLSQLAGWVIAAERSQQRYGLRLPERTLPPGIGAAHCDRCLEALALHGQA